MQESRFECLSFDPFSLFQNGFVAAEVDVRRCDIVQALVVAPVIVMVDEGFDLSFEVAGQEVVFQQYAVLERLVPTLDFAQRLRMIWRTARMLHTFVQQPFGQVTRDITGAVVAKKTRLVNDVDLITT